MAAVETGIPMVLAPCGLDILSYGGRADMLEKTKDRVQYVQDALRVQVRTTADELRQAADVIATRLNRAKGRVDLPGAAQGLVVARQGRPADLRPGRRRGLRRAAEGKARSTRSGSRRSTCTCTRPSSRASRSTSSSRLFEAVRGRAERVEELQP